MDIPLKQRTFASRFTIFVRTHNTYIKCLIRLAEEHNKHVRISIGTLPAILINMKVEKMDFQISFRGMTRDVIDRIISSGYCGEGHFEGHYLQPIATALYQYSYLLRWKGLCMSSCK